MDEALIFFGKGIYTIRCDTKRIYFDEILWMLKGKLEYKESQSFYLLIKYFLPYKNILQSFVHLINETINDPPLLLHKAQND